MKLSIVTITYNNLKGFKRTAQSIIGQTDADYEWVVIDGGSVDGTVDYIRTLERQPNYFCSEPDNGIYDAINKGISYATGEYVCCMNAGDWFSDKFVFHNILNKLNADIVYGDWAIIDRKGRIQDRYAPREMPAYFFFFDYNLCHQAMFVKTNLLQDSPFDTSYKICADWKKWQQFMIEERSFSHLPIKICVHDNRDGISSDMDSPVCKAEILRMYSEMPKEIGLIALLVKKEMDRLRYKNHKHLHAFRWSIVLNIILLILSIVLLSIILQR